MKEASHKRLHIVWFCLHEVSRIYKSVATENGLKKNPRDCGGNEETANRYKISSCGYKNPLKLGGANSCVPCEYNTKTIELYTLCG